MNTDKLTDEIYDDLKKLEAYTKSYEKQMELSASTLGKVSAIAMLSNQTIDRKLKLLELCLLVKEEV